MLVIAHRGASRAEPENTLAAFRRAVEMGADAVELDARRTADGAVVVHHDPHLPDGRALVAVAAAGLPASIPALDAAVTACGPLLVNVEIKNTPGEPDFDETERVAAAVARLAEARGDDHRLLVSSFHRPTIDAVRALAPQVPTAWLTVLVDDAGRLADELAGAGHAAVHPHHLGVDAALVQRFHERGVAVNVWTCDDPERMRALVDAGVDGICTNVPDVLLSVLGR